MRNDFSFFFPGLKGRKHKTRWSVKEEGRIVSHGSVELIVAVIVVPIIVPVSVPHWTSPPSVVEKRMAPLFPINKGLRGRGGGGRKNAEERVVVLRVFKGFFSWYKKNKNCEEGLAGGRRGPAWRLTAVPCSRARRGRSRAARRRWRGRGRRRGRAPACPRRGRTTRLRG